MLSSTYTVEKVCTDELVMWHCPIVVSIGRCPGGWGWLNDGRQWLLEVEVKQVGGHVNGGGGGDTRCTGMNVKVRKMRNKDQVPQEKP